MTRPSPKANSKPSRLLRRALRAHHDGDFERAERLYNGVLHSDTDSFDALHGLGQLHYRRGRLDTALTLFQAALTADLDRADGFASLGLVFHSLKRFNEALRSYDEGLLIAPNDHELRNRRGVALLELGRPSEALAEFDRVLAGMPDDLNALGNRGNALIKLNRPEEALTTYDRALQLEPDNAQLLTNRAVVLRRLDRPHEAMLSARRALVGKSDFAPARFVDSVARLTLGDFTAWRDYEARWSVGFLAAQRRSFTAPLWLGREPLDGKTILLHAEQGYGDTLQFVRYAPLLAARGANVILEVQPELLRLLSPIAGAAAVIARGKALPHFDFHCPLMSLPLACATELASIPAAVPYVAADAGDIARWQGLLPVRRPLVGLAWSGERTHDNDLNRSLRLAALLPLLDLPDAIFVSLQHDVREDDLALINARHDVAQLGQKFADFADTAAIVALLDAVISVDTVVAHLAGAMGKPLFLLLPFAADFRWLRERVDSPWYPTARLYRQPRFGDWSSVIETLRRDLARANLAAGIRRLSA